MVTEKINNMHRDMWSKVSLTLVTFICITALTGTIGIFRAQIVFASDLDTALKPIKAQLAQQSEINKQMAQGIDDLGLAVKDGNVRYIEDQIIQLEVTATERSLTPTETQRLLRYQADLARIKQ